MRDPATDLEPVMDKDALIAEIGKLIAADPKVNAKPWDQFALVVFYGDQLRKLNGFRYLEAESAGNPATPQSTELGARLDELREATRIEGKEPWRACVVRIDRVKQKIALAFEYNAPEQWEVTPATLSGIAERARPRAN